MIDFKNFKSTNILNIFENNFSIKFKENRNFLILDNKKKLIKLLYNKKRKKFRYIIINTKKIRILGIIKIIIFFFKEKNYNKNFLIVYKFKKEVRANNLIPDFPILNKSSFFRENIYIWIKSLLSCLVFYKKIELIMFRLK